LCNLIRVDDLCTMNSREAERAPARRRARGETPEGREAAKREPGAGRASIESESSVSRPPEETLAPSCSVRPLGARTTTRQKDRFEAGIHSQAHTRPRIHVRCIEHRAADVRCAIDAFFMVSSMVRCVMNKRFPLVFHKVFFCFRFVFSFRPVAAGGAGRGSKGQRHRRLASRTTLTASQGTCNAAMKPGGSWEEAAVRASARRPSWNSTVECPR